MNAPTTPEKTVEHDPLAEEQRLVIYTDGGARPNPGNAGWGFHGYLYHPVTPKRGSGNPNHILTDRGYISKEEVRAGKTTQAVTPIIYVDGFGSFPEAATNNAAEILAATHAIRFALDHVVTTLKIYTDSEHVKNGMTSWVKGWQKNGWRTKNGTMVSNVDDWHRLVELRDQLEARGCKVEFHWVRGHNDDFGNELADMMATLGVMHAKQGVSHNEVTKSQAEGYWKYDAEIHPFLSLPALYFNTRADTYREGEYYIGNQYKEIDLLGKRVSDGAFAVVRLKERDTVIDEIQQHVMKLAHGTDNIMFMRLDQLFRADTHAQISKWGHLATDQPNPHAYDLDCLDSEPMLREIRKPKLAYRAIEAISDLSMKIDEFLAQDKNLVVTDLTHQLFEERVKTNKKGTTSTWHLKEQFHVGLASMEVEANYALTESGEGYYTVPLILTLGIDLLDRNKLKRLESRQPKVSLIAWMESDVSFRHATIIQVEDDIGIWAGIYSNIRLLPVAPSVTPVAV